MNKISNISLWQKNVVQERARLIDLFLAQLTNQRVKFEYITDLATRLAAMIESQEQVSWQAHLMEFENTPNNKQHIRRPRGCAASTLLRSGDFRPKLDAWCAENGMGGPQKKAAEHNMTMLQLKLDYGILSKRLKIYQDRVEKLEKELDQNKNGDKGKEEVQLLTTLTGDGVTNDMAQTCEALYVLINEFEAQVLLDDDGNLVNNSFGKKIIISKDLLTHYYKWLEIKNNGRILK